LVIDKKIVSRIWSDFKPYRKTLQGAPKAKSETSDLK